MSSPDSASVKVTCNCSISHLENLPYSQIKEKMVKTYPLPPHWQPPNPSRLLGILHYFLFTTLCLCAYGQLNLESLWATIKLDSREGNPKAWREGQHRMSNQLNNVLVVAGLLLATSAVFITTEPPDTSKLDYTRRGPYLCIYIAFGLLIGAIIVTSVWILVTEKITSSRTEDVLYGNTLHLYCTLILVAYPSVTISIAMLLLAYGLLASAWVAKDPGFQFSGVVLLVLPLTISVMFAIVNMPIRKGTSPQSISA